MPETKEPVMFVSEALLEQQISAVLNSNMPEEEKSGVHSFLGEIVSKLIDEDNYEIKIRKAF